MTRLWVGCAVANVVLACGVVAVVDDPVVYLSGYFTGLGAALFAVAAYLWGSPDGR